MPFYITKLSGKKELFSLEKLGESLRKAGASPILVGEIINEIKTLHPKDTREVHDFAFARLEQQNRPIAARYNLKEAIMQLGPAGYPFEQFVARVLQAQGYQTTTNQVVQGICVSHEIDVIAIKDGKSYLIECKFHNRMGLKSDVKVPLYIQARFEDITQAEQHNSSRLMFDQPWLWCNTQFTSDAIKYAQCVNMRITGWSYPEGQSLVELIDRYGLHPITALTSITRRKKNILIQEGLILCRDAQSYKDQLPHWGFKPYEIEQIITEAQGVCAIESK